MKNILKILFILVINSSYAQISDFESIDFTVADNVAKLNEGQSLDNLALLAYELTYKLPTEVEKFRAIYSWVCHNIKGDPNQDILVSKKRWEFKNDSLGYLKWNDQYKKVVFQKLLKRKKTMCTGYAYLIKELCYLANIESKIINGYGRTTSINVDKLELTNHSWNAVKLDGKWYLCDPTWSSGYIDDYNVYIKEYNEGYFLTDPVLFAQSHYPSEKKWLLNDSLVNSKFVATALVYGETYKRKIIPIFPKEMHLKTKKNAEVSFSFKPLKDIPMDKISLIQYLGINEKEFDIYDLKFENGLVTFNCKFKYNKFYDVHLKIEDDIVATYTVKVES